MRALPRRDELRGAVAEPRDAGAAALAADGGREFERALAERARLGKRAEEIDARLARAHVTPRPSPSTKIWPARRRASGRCTKDSAVTSRSSARPRS